MEHLGDITRISGYTAPIVDCIIGGSPCQDLSIAGKRAGLDGERSGLFMEQIRIIKEMRKRNANNGTTDIRPRYMVWENVPGAFSSNKGEDFRIVLEETAKVADENAVIPEPPKGKWTTSGCIVGDGWSIAWRVLDAQFWGVPQRRRRIALVADFGGQSAQEILFVRKGVPGDTEQGEQKRKNSSEDASGSLGVCDRERGQTYHPGRSDGDFGVLQGTRKDCTGVDIYNTALTGDKTCPLTAEGYGSTGTSPKVITFELGITGREGGHIYEGVSGTLRANAGDNQMATAYGSLPSDTVFCLQGNGIDRADTAGCNGKGWREDVSYTLNTLDRPAVVYSVENHPQDSRVKIDEEGKVQTHSGRMGTGGGNVPLVMQQCYSKRKRAQSVTDNETWVESDTANTLNAFDIGDVRTTEAVVFALDRASFNQGKNAQFDFEVSDKGINSPLVAKGPSAVCYGWYPQMKAECITWTEDKPLINGTCPGHKSAVCYEKNQRYTVRRLTPLECERLQGYPDGWTDIGDWTDTNGKVRKTSDAARYKALGNSIALPPWKWVIKRLCACYERDATMASLFDGIGGFPYIWEQINGKGSCLWASEIEEFPIAVTKERIRNEKV